MRGEHVVRYRSSMAESGHTAERETYLLDPFPRKAVGHALVRRLVGPCRVAGNQLHGLRDRHFDFIICHAQVLAREAIGRDSCAKTVVIAGDRNV